MAWGEDWVCCSCDHARAHAAVLVFFCDIAAITSGQRKRNTFGDGLQCGRIPAFAMAMILPLPALPALSPSLGAISAGLNSCVPAAIAFSRSKAFMRGCQGLPQGWHVGWFLDGFDNVARPCLVL